MTHLCVPIFVTELEKARRDIAAAKDAGADLVELRIDKLGETSIHKSLLAERVLPAIVTCRTVDEGGFSTLTDDRRLALLSEAMNDGARYVDLELRTAGTLEKDSELILSFHDFTGKPSNLGEIIGKMNRRAAHVNKLVWRAKQIGENLEALALLKTATRPTVALCMGEAGLISRVLARKFGAFLTFASLADESATAPGQVTISDLKSLYRWDAIGANTKVFGVVACPVRHSMSPAIHNAAFSEIGFDGVYLPMLVEPDYDSFKSFIEGFLRFEGMNLSGLSITIPHKENALRYLRETGGEIEEIAARIGAVNTISVRSDGKLEGKNTDYAAILDCITAELGIDRDDLGKIRVAILGAGGTSRAAVAALAHYGAKVIISNRTMDRAKLLADEFDSRDGKVSAVTLDELCRSDWGVLINTTSVGMYPKIDENPLADHKLALSEKTVVFDTIYNPMKTKLLAMAEERGSRTIGGVEMFVRQAAAQFETWTGQAAPTEVMRRVIIARLGNPQTK